MVASITPGATGASALGVDTRSAETRSTRPQLTLPQRAAANDSVSLSDAAQSWRSARDSVQNGLAALDLALAVGREALQRLIELADAARTGEGAQDALDAYRKTLDAAPSSLLAGEDLVIEAEPNGAPITVAGADVSSGAVRLPVEASSVSGAALARTAQDAINLVQAHLSRLDAAARGLEAHVSFLGAAENAAGVRADVDTDGARLLALQVRQGLEAAGSTPIANAQPQAVLSLFRV